MIDDDWVPPHEVSVPGLLDLLAEINGRLNYIMELMEENWG